MRAALRSRDARAAPGASSSRPPEVERARVELEAVEAGERRGGSRKAGCRARAEPHRPAPAVEVAHGEPREAGGGSARGKHVIRARDVVAESGRGVGADKESSGGLK